MIYDRRACPIWIDDKREYWTDDTKLKKCAFQKGL